MGCTLVLKNSKSSDAEEAEAADALEGGAVCWLGKPASKAHHRTKAAIGPPGFRDSARVETVNGPRLALGLLTGQPGAPHSAPREVSGVSWGRMATPRRKEAAKKVAENKGKKKRRELKFPSLGSSKSTMCE